MNVKKCRYILIIVLLIIIILFIYAFNNKIITKLYTIKTSILNKDSSIRIVLLSDLHSTIYGDDQQPLVQKIKDQTPDLILLSGDIADDIVPIAGTEMLLSQICDIAPIYYVTGNHEYWSRDIQTIRDKIEEFGVTILSDSYEQIEINGNKIIIAGIEDPDKRIYEEPNYSQSETMKVAFENLEDVEGFKILIAHRPENIKTYLEYPFDLVISGHSHGGQVRIPFILNGLYAPNQGLFPKYAGGFYQYDSLYHIISRGLSINPRLPRIFNPPELVVINIESN